MTHPAYFRLLNALNAPIYSLVCRNSKFGTGYEVVIEGSNVTLQLMDDNSTIGKVIHELKATSNEIGFAFIDDITTQLENQLFQL